MLGTYFYHQVIAKTVTGFGTLFNNILIKHRDQEDNTVSTIRVPVFYGPIEKFIAKLQQQEELERSVAITLPLIAYEMTSITYANDRKVALTQFFKACDSEGNVNKVFLPVPYDIGFQLQILSKKQADCLQIVEQILPFFQPSFNLTINLIDDIEEKRDIPIVLNSVDFQDDYEGDFSTRRSLIYTLNFTAKSYFFGPATSPGSGDSLIRKALVDFYSTSIDGGTRELRYTVTPDPIDAGPGDNYEFLETVEDFFDARVYSPTQQIDVDP